MNCIDLHVHTTASDGSDSPAELVEHAIALGLSAIAVTDHNTASGYREAKALGDTRGLEVVPGIEISTKYGGAVHILGYYIDPDAPALQKVLDWVLEDRETRNRGIAALMAADGLNVDYDEMYSRFGAVIGRPHFAELLFEQGAAESITDAFTRLLNKGCHYYVPSSILSIDRSIQAIADAGGIPVLAHPFQYKRDDPGLRELIEYCMGFGLRGMECRYSGYTAEQEEYLEALAAEYSLIKTGGSDYHGSMKPNIALGSTGARAVPYSWLDELKTAHKSA